MKYAERKPREARVAPYCPSRRQGSAPADGQLAQTRRNREQEFGEFEFGQILNWLYQSPDSHDVPSSQRVMADRVGESSCQRIPDEGESRIPMNVARSLAWDFSRSADIPSGYASDGCFARAGQMCDRMLRMGLSPRKAYIFGGLRYRSGSGAFARDIVWGYHVAPIINIHTSLGCATRRMIIDPAMRDEPIELHDWLQLMQADSCVEIESADPHDLAKKINEYRRQHAGRAIFCTVPPQFGLAASSDVEFFHSDAIDSDRLAEKYRELSDIDRLLEGERLSLDELGGEEGRPTLYWSSNIR